MELGPANGNLMLRTSGCVGNRAKKSVTELNPLIGMENRFMHCAGRGCLRKPIHYRDTGADLTCGDDLPIFPAAVAVDSALRGLTNPQKPMENHERSRRRVAG